MTSDFFRPSSNGAGSLAGTAWSTTWKSTCATSSPSSRNDARYAPGVPPWRITGSSISVRSITKLYGAQKALDDVSFEIGSKEVVGFLGPNGAGKSTMMRILTCFLPPSSGEASVCGFDTRTASMDVRRNVGYLPENNPLYVDLYVREYLEFV